MAEPIVRFCLSASTSNQQQALATKDYDIGAARVSESECECGKSGTRTECGNAVKVRQL